MTLWIAASALYQNGNLSQAFPEERLNRSKGFQGFPSNSINQLLLNANLEIRDVDLFCVGWNHINILNVHPRFSKP